MQQQGTSTFRHAGHNGSPAVPSADTDRSGLTDLLFARRPGGHALKPPAEIDNRKSRSVESRYLGGLAIEETAHVLEISPEAVVHDVFRSRLGSGISLGTDT